MGEDPKVYRRLLDHTVRAAEPRTFIEYNLARDIADLSWEIARYRRLKSEALNAVYEAFLPENDRPGKDATRSAAGESPTSEPLPLTLPDKSAAFQSAARDWQLLDQLEASAENRRNSLLLMLDYCQQARIREVCDTAVEIIDAEAPSIAPEQSKSQSPDGLRAARQARPRESAHKD
jgi:hypothetical protein